MSGNYLPGSLWANAIQDEAKVCSCSAGRQACMQADNLRYVTCKPIKVGIYNVRRKPGYSVPD